MRRTTQTLLLCTLGILHAVPAALAGETGAAETLRPYQARVLTVQDMQRQREITAAQAKVSIERYVQNARAACQCDVTLESLTALETGGVTVTTPEEDAVQKGILGFITFIDIVFYIASVLAIIFCCILATALVESHEAKEALVYLGAISLLAISFSDPFELQSHFEFLGAIGLLGAIAFSAANKRFGDDPKASTIAGVLCFVWTILALWLGNSGIGFIAVTALFAAAGFYAGMDHFLIMIGFKNDDVVPRCTTISAILLGFYIAAAKFGTTFAPLGLFEAGSLVVGGLVFYLGLLVMSCRYYWRKGRANDYYWMFQIAMPILCLTGIWAGSVLGLIALTKLGGTFLVLWTLEKIIDVPAKSVAGFAIQGIVVCGAFVAGVLYLRAHAETLGQYVIGF